MADAADEHTADVPDHFTCPVCHQLMRQPVLLVCCGRSCCEPCILHWMDARSQQSLSSTCCSCSQPIRRSRDDLVRNVCLRQAIEAFCVAQGRLMQHIPTSNADISGRASAPGAAHAIRPDLLALITELQRASPMPGLLDAQRRGIANGAALPEDAAVEGWLRRLHELAFSPDGVSALLPVGSTAALNRAALVSANVPLQLLALTSVYVTFLCAPLDPPDRGHPSQRHEATSGRSLSAAQSKILERCLSCVCDLAREEADARALLQGGFALTLCRLLRCPRLPEGSATAAIACVPVLASNPCCLRMVTASALPGLLCVFAAGGRLGDCAAWRALAGSELPSPSDAVAHCASLALARLDVRDVWVAGTAAECAARVCEAARALASRLCAEEGEGGTAASAAAGGTGGSEWQGPAAAAQRNLSLPLAAGSGGAVPCSAVEEPLGCAVGLLSEVLAHLGSGSDQQAAGAGEAETSSGIDVPQGAGAHGTAPADALALWLGRMQLQTHHAAAATEAAGEDTRADERSSAHTAPDDPSAAGAPAGFCALRATEQLNWLRYYIQPHGLQEASAYRSALSTLGTARWLSCLICASAADEVDMRLCALYTLLDLCRGHSDEGFAAIWPHVPLDALVRLACGSAHARAPVPAAGQVNESAVLYEQQLAAVRTLWQLAAYGCAVDALSAHPMRRLLAQLASGSRPASAHPLADGQASTIKEAATEMERTISHTLLRRSAPPDPADLRWMSIAVHARALHPGEAALWHL